MTNLTPPTRIGAAGAFDRRERYAVRYADAYVRYRVRFRGRFTGATAGGRLRLRATVRTRRGGRVIARCDTRRRAWTAWADGDPPGTPPPPATPPPPGGTTPPPDPTFRRPATPGPWSFDMTSDPGEYLGQGLTWHHGSAYGEPIRVDVFAAGDIIQFTIQTRDADSWSGSFATLDGTPLRVGHLRQPRPGLAELRRLRPRLRHVHRRVHRRGAGLRPRRRAPDGARDVRGALRGAAGGAARHVRVPGRVTRARRSGRLAP